jgi:formylglycine-generating enzyme required for sulfatase activity
VVKGEGAAAAMVGPMSTIRRPTDGDSSGLVTNTRSLDIEVTDTSAFVVGRTKGQRVAIVVVALVLVFLLGAVWFGWPHLVFWSRFERLGANPKGLVEYRHRKSGIVLVRIPAGTFLMGTSEEQLQAVTKPIKNWRTDWVEREAPQHEVNLSAFLIGKHEVTQEQWMKFMPENHSYFRKGSAGYADLQPIYQTDEVLKTFPVETVTWSECQEFCEKLGLKLPSEAQWEYACRACTSGEFGGTGRREDMGWLDTGMHPVGLKQPNAWGLHDMHGNVCEWCEDAYDAEFYSKPEARAPDPVCRAGMGDRVWRGGGWNMAEFQHRSAFRGHSATSGNRVQQSLPGHIGLRVAYYPLP